ncbi:nucleoside deaminase [Telluribacter sp. SYSU D00476]|uniref:nucleoside deaminase n=1 Tax=Telluribacter sp. SYSU D00476 TaxID=2811430 RepID=UPI001FF21A4D|nr:nucleoside deaminase [Telluribacter sp. SYSU D00476]
MDLYTDNYFMGEALYQAHRADEAGEIPVGAVVVCKQRIIARAYNQTELLHDVTAHAEILAITAASEYLGAKYLQDCTLYVTLEPCVMCAGALYWAQLGRVVYGAGDDKRGFRRLGKSVLHPKTSLDGGVREEECRQLLLNFFRRLRT